MTDEVAASLGQQGEWLPWLNRAIREGNPIWDAWSRKLKRAVRVLQLPQYADTIEIGAYIEIDGGESEIEMPKTELVIHLSLSEESAQLAKELLSYWMKPETTPEIMQTYIDEMHDKLD